MAAFNSREFAFSDMSLLVNGTKISGLRAIEYTEEQEKEFLHASGSEPQGIQPGNKSYKGTLTVLQDTIIALEKQSPTGSILDLEAMVVVTYAKFKVVKLRTDVIGPLEFTSVPKGMKQNDKFMEVALPFLALGVQNGA